MREIILEQVDIRDVIGIKDKNKIPCPFPDHDDHDPSFVIYPDSFYCFGCKRGGTVIDFVMYRDGVMAGEAMRWLCEKYGIPMRDWTPEEKKQWENQKREKDVVLQIFAEAAEYYHSKLTQKRREYFRNRGLTDETINKLKLGYADGKLFDAFKDGKIGKHNEHGLVLSGLFRRFKNGNVKDVFERRYILPYWNKEKVVYFIGRRDTDDPKEIEKLPKWNQQKYYKLPVFDQEKRPYVSQSVQNNYFYGEDSIGENEVGIITEGVIDCIHLLQAGYSSISPVTEEFKDKDLPKLAKLASHWKTTYIVNDNEESGEGERGAAKTGAFLFEKGINVHIVTLPRPAGVKKVDVADFFNVPPEQYPARKNEFQSLIDKSDEFVVWQINRARKLSNSAKREMTWQIFSMIADCDDKLQLQEYSDLMQEAGLVANAKTFNDSLKKQQIQKRKAAKAKRMKFVEETDPALYLKLQIEEIRKSNYKKAFEIKRDMTNLVIRDMKERGKFYYTISNQYFWFENETKVLHRIGDELLEANILKWYGINGSETEYEYLKSALRGECLEGTLTDVYQFAFYHAGSNKLYVYSNADQIYQLNGTNIQLIDNGTDGILFLKNPLWEPFQYLPEVKNEEYIKPLLLSQINFDAGEECSLNSEEQRLLLLYWIYSLFFASILPAKPVMTLTGQQGSGKTTTQRMIGKMLFGSKFDVTALTSEDDFDAATTHNPIVFYDQVDSYIRWLNDRIAHTATGKMIQKRQLYTTNELVTFFPRCFLSISSFEPNFKRADVVDRLLLFHTVRREKLGFGSEYQLFQNILAKRNELMSELFNDLNAIIKQLSHDKEPFTSSYRMGDWATLCWRIAKINNQGDDFVQLLEKMVKGQSEFILESHPIFLCLDYWMLDKNNHNRECDASMLYSEFQLISETEKMPFRYKDVRRFGRDLRTLVPSISKFFNVKTLKKKNKWYYVFSLKEE